MAEYKIVNAEKLDADLTSVANAIRKRSGTTAKMEFPAGFESAVKNIPIGGAELPKLTNPASATDLALDKQLIDQNGNIVIGALNEVTNVLGLAKQPDSVVYSSERKEVQILSGMYSPTDFIARRSIKFRSRVPAAEFGNAFADDVVAGRTFTSENGVMLMGTHVCKSEGGIDTSDATATADQILKNRTAYAKGEKLTGTIESLATTTITPGTTAQAITKKYIDGTLTIKGDSNLKAENIKKGVSIFGVDGSHECEEGVTLPELSNPGIASDVASGKELIDQNGNKVTGTLKNEKMLRLTGGTAYGYIGDGSGVLLDASADVDRIIRAGDDIGVVATYDKFGNATAADVAKGKTFTSAAGFLVKGEHECECGVELPELGDTAAQPTDIVSGKVLYDDKGNPVTGTLHEVVEGKIAGASTDPIVRYNSDGSIYIMSKTATIDALVRAGAYLRATAPGSLFGDATADDVVKGKFFTSAAGVMVEGTMEAASGGGLAVKKGSTSSTTIDTGLSSIDYVVLLADSFSGTGLLQLLYRKPNNSISYILCTSYSYNSRKTELNHASMASSTLLTIDGGKVTWNGTGTSAFMSGASYMWLAFGTE